MAIGASARPGPPVVPDRIERRLEPLPYGQVRLLPGPVKDAFDTNLRYLKTLEPDRFLWTFRRNAGLATPGEPYGGWEGPDVELRGHSIGHYLSACARVIAQTADPELERKAKAAALRLGLAYERRNTGFGGLADFLRQAS